MNCSAPLPGDDDSPNVPDSWCQECNGFHHPDICPTGRLLAPWLVGILCIALVVCMFALWCMGVER